MLRPISSRERETHYDVAIIGAGPGGLAAALWLHAQAPSVSTILLEAGRGLKQRPCPVDRGKECAGCGGICNVISGFGGCIHYGDGVKLSLLPSGRRLIDLYGERTAAYLCDEAVEMFTSYLTTAKVVLGTGISPSVHELFNARGTQLREYGVIPLAEAETKVILEGMWSNLLSSRSVDLALHTDVRRISRHGSDFVLETRKGDNSVSISAKRVILATGRCGLTLGDGMLAQLGVHAVPPTFSVGVRFEMDARWLRDIGLVHPDMKLSGYGSSPLKFKTFCFCGGANGGRLKFTNYQTSFGFEAITLDGHETLEREATDRPLAGNFGVLVQALAQPDEYEHKLFQTLETYRLIAGAAPIVQPYDSFRDCEAVNLSWNDLYHTMPFEPSVRAIVGGEVWRLFTQDEHRALVEGFEQVMGPILEFEGSGMRLDDLRSEILVLGLELELAWPQSALKSTGESNVGGLFVVGDAAGYAQGIVQAAMMGIQAARSCVQAHSDTL